MADSADPPLPFQLWEYRVIHINVENNAPPEAPNPQVASQKLQGMLSPEFIAREFPQQYGAPPPPRHPAEQLQFFLNLLGKEGWDMVGSERVGVLLMFFFRRPLRPLPKALPPPASAQEAPAEEGLADGP
ncbi:hypothetical protein [Cyanobium sp. ATX 6F1]|uniref:hypothetical protein n=1 Tax=Cyanobium sp. ATX 6F1 TaxID=2823702 RepID=UPI0020CDAE52|nr:hypothetical protein [Cyanobium sp. ATX 6F1]MCP9917597.1 hypothetical protein [Cyanobium sp. ATX 6F1]